MVTITDFDRELVERARKTPDPIHNPEWRRRFDRTCQEADFHTTAIIAETQRGQAHTFNLLRKERYRG